MKKTAYLFILFCLNLSPVIAETTSQTPRILELLPHLQAPINIEPAIPAHFALIKYDKEMNTDYIWGSKETSLDSNGKLEEKETYIQVLSQTYENQTNWKSALSQFKSQFPNGFQTSNFKWGDYSGVAIKMMICADPQYLAQVYLNDQEGTVLIFRLMYPMPKPFGNGNKPSQSDLDLWDHFLKNTKETVK